MLRLLVDHPACDVVPLTVDEWPALVAGTRVFGRLDVASALLLAMSVDGYVLTSERDIYGELTDGYIIDF